MNNQLSKKIPFKTSIQIFAICAFPIHVWTVVTMFYQLGGWIIYRDIVELLSLISYLLLFAFVETLFIFIPIILLALILPKKIIKDNIIPLSLSVVIVAVLGGLSLHFYQNLFHQKILLAIFLFMVFALLVFLVYKFPKIAKVFKSISDRISLLSYIFIFADFLAIIVVISRNLIN